MATTTRAPSATFEELRALRPAKTPAQIAALSAADFAMDTKYAGSYVAYIDAWTGDELDRTIVAAAAEFAALQDELAKLQPDVRRRVQLTQIPAADTLSAPSVWLS